ncbi:MAG: hypothetical protein E7332_00395 [Clostridiales bacterium]|nr:hypothetical protein [Clostridiales bacterium]
MKKTIKIIICILFCCVFLVNCSCFQVKMNEDTTDLIETNWENNDKGQSFVVDGKSYICIGKDYMRIYPQQKRMIEQTKNGEIIYACDSELSTVCYKPKALGELEQLTDTYEQYYVLEENYRGDFTIEICDKFAFVKTDAASADRVAIGRLSRIEEPLYFDQMDVFLEELSMSIPTDMNRENIEPIGQLIGFVDLYPGLVCVTTVFCSEESDCYMLVWESRTAERISYLPKALIQEYLIDLTTS